MIEQELAKNILTIGVCLGIIIGFSLSDIYYYFKIKKVFKYLGEKKLLNNYYEYKKKQIFWRR